MNLNCVEKFDWSPYLYIERWPIILKSNDMVQPSIHKEINKIYLNINQYVSFTFQHKTKIS